MNKLAAEKIAQEYYQLGLELALVKEAGLPKEVIKKMIQIPVSGLSGMSAVTHIPHLEKILGDDLALILGLGGGAMLGAKGAGKAVDLAHSGGSKLLNKLRS